MTCSVSNGTPPKPVPLETPTEHHQNLFRFVLSVFRWNYVQNTRDNAEIVLKMVLKRNKTHNGTKTQRNTFQNCSVFDGTTTKTVPLCSVITEQNTKNNPKPTILSGYIATTCFRNQVAQPLITVQLIYRIVTKNKSWKNFTF